MAGPAPRGVWLRRLGWNSRHETRRKSYIDLTRLGAAAAKETLVTASPHFAATWTGLFLEMLTTNQTLRWQGNGLGIGRDARIAYSGLLGRYVARWYLAEHEGVHTLVPLDVAEPHLASVGYAIEKRPAGRGALADWVGMDRWGRLVIAEAKGSFDRGVQPWRGPGSRHQAIDTAMRQVKRTRVLSTAPWPLRVEMPARRWAVASRWATETPKPPREPTTVAAYEGDGVLGADDRRALTQALLASDADACLQRMGQIEPTELAGDERRVPPGARSLRVGDREIEPGFIAMAGPFGMAPVREEFDVNRISRLLADSWLIAILSLSRRYVIAALEDAESYLRGMDAPPPSGLTVVWPAPSDEITLGA